MIKRGLHIILVCLLWSCQQPATIPEKNLTPKIETNLVMTPTQISAGQAIHIRADLNNSDYEDQNFALHLSTALGSKTYPVTAVNGKIDLDIAGTDNQVAGLVQVQLSYHNHLIQKDQFHISPGMASDKIDSYNGPKTLFAQDEDGSMHVTVPHDKFGNPLMENSSVQFSSNFEGSEKSIKDVDIDHLIAYEITTSRKEEGKYLVGANANESYTREQEIIIESTMPSNIKINLIKHYPFADSRQFVQINSDPIKDPFNNVVADGTLINFVVYEEDVLVSNYHAFTVGGSANVYIENPSKETSWTVYASLFGSARSNGLKLSFKRNVQDFELSYDQIKKQIQIGPVFGDLKQLVPDGTEAIIMAPMQNLKSNIFLENGKAKFDLPFLWDMRKEKNIEVIIGGFKKTVALK